MITPDERAKAIEEFFSEIELAQGKLRALLKRLLSDKKLTDSEMYNLIKGVNFFDQLRALGGNEAVGKLLTKYDDTISSIVKLAKKSGKDLTGFGIDQLVNLADMDASVILKRADMFSQEFKSSLLKTMIAGEPREKIVSEILPKIQEEVYFRTSWFNTAVNQSFTKFHNVSLRRAFEDSPETKFFLEHPLDKVTRPICIHAINEAKKYPDGLTIEEINSGKLGREYTFEDLGGFNCRGFFYPNERTMK